MEYHFYDFTLFIFPFMFLLSVCFNYLLNEAWFCKNKAVKAGALAILISDNNLIKFVWQGTKALFIKDHAPILAFLWLYQQQDQVKEEACWRDQL